MVKSLDWSVGPNSQFKPTTSKGSPKGSHKKNGKSLVRLTKRVDHGPPPPSNTHTHTFGLQSAYKYS